MESAPATPVKSTEEHSKTVPGAPKKPTNHAIYTPGASARILFEEEDDPLTLAVLDLPPLAAVPLSPVLES